MAKLREEAEPKPDDLEIISIGALYKGSWDKKYWSCSRGKDRYPYPVGYQAVRAQEGHRCTMEIHEGSKGPLFEITNADGISYSGETPAIAWERFQKKCYPNMKIWHGKRFSCKTDGIEFFGFKNAFVQRLLRELVANLDGEAQQSLLSSTSINGASIHEHERGRMAKCANPDLLACIIKPTTTGKRSQRCGSIKRLGTEDSLKILQRQMQSSAMTSHPRPKRQKNCTNTFFSEESNAMTVPPISFQRQTSSDDLMLSSKADEGAPAASIHKNDSDGLSNGIGRADIIAGGSNDCPGNCVSTEIAETSTFLLILSSKEDGEALAENIHKKDQIIDSVKLSNDVERADIMEGRNDYPGNSVSTETFGRACKLEEPLDRFQTSEVHQMNSSMSLENNEDGVFAADSAVPNDEILCADDTLDALQANPCGHATISQKMVYNSKLEDESGAEHAVKPEDNSRDFAPTATKKDCYCILEDKSATARMVKIEPTVDESSPEEDTGPYISAGSSERTDFDSVGQGIDRTMMSVWLPQAVPLLKQYSRKRKQIKTRDAMLSGYTQMKQGVLPNQVIEADDVIKNPKNPEFLAHSNPEADESGDQAYYQDIPDSMDVSGAESMLYHDKLQSICDSKPLEDESHLRAHILTHKPNGPHFSESVSLHINTISSKKHCEEMTVSKECLADENESRTSSKNTGHGTFRRGYQHGDCIPTMALEKVCEVPLSESIICRISANDDIPDSYLSHPNLLAQNIHKPSSLDKINHSSYSAAELVNDGDPSVLMIPTATLEAEDELHVLPVGLQNQTSVSTSESNNTSNSFHPVSQVKESQSLELMNIDEKKNTVQSEDTIPSPGLDAGFSDELFIVAEDCARLHIQMTGNVNFHNKCEEILQLVGCYSHSLPIMSVLLRIKGHELYVCVQCGLLAGEIHTIFLYNLLLEEPRKGCPSFIGHTPVLPPVTDHAYATKKDESWYQVTPDGKNVVLLGNVKIPFCREGLVSCSCSVCVSVLLDGSAVRIVQLNLGYVTLVLELKAKDNLLSILVCDPNYLVAVGEKGRLHVWIMNPSWSGRADEFDLPTSNSITTCIMELKKVPKCAALVVGYNGFGEFTLWDLSRRILVSKFSSLSSTSPRHFLPISSLSCSLKDLSSTKSDDHINSIMASTKQSFQKNSDDGHCSVQLERDEVFVWILASAVSNVENDCQSNAQALEGLWRLALLAKNRVILGSPLDTRASSVGALSGNGILGTSDGLVYMWDLSTGAKLGNLHQFRGGSVSCISTSDDSISGFVAIAGENGELMIYQSR